MICWLCRRYLDLWFDQELKGWMENFVKSHVGACVKCREELEWLRKIRYLIQREAEEILLEESLKPLITHLKSRLATIPAEKKPEIKEKAKSIFSTQLRLLLAPAFTLIVGLALGWALFTEKPATQLEKLSFPPSVTERAGERFRSTPKSGDLTYSEEESLEKPLHPEKRIAEKTPESIRPQQVQLPEKKEKKASEAKEEIPLQESVLKTPVVERSIFLVVEIRKPRERMEGEAQGIGEARALGIVRPPPSEVVLRVELPEELVFKLKKALAQNYEIEEKREESRIIWVIEEKPAEKEETKTEREVKEK